MEVQTKTYLKSTNSQNQEPTKSQQMDIFIFKFILKQKEQNPQHRRKPQKTTTKPVLPWYFFLNKKLPDLFVKIDLPPFYLCNSTLTFLNQQ